MVVVEPNPVLRIRNKAGNAAGSRGRPDRFRNESSGTEPEEVERPHNVRVLVSGCTATVKRLAAHRPDRIGVLLTPANGNAEWWDESMPWACDNDCFKGLDASAYLKLLGRILKFKTRPQWVACPDALCDPRETRRRFNVWQPILTELGLPVAMVGQDGLLPDVVPWDYIDCLFIGGSTAWKCGDDAARLTLEAHKLGKMVHVGRVNSLRRILYFGRRMRDFGDIRIPKAIRWIDKALACKQSVMFGGNA